MIIAHTADLHIDDRPGDSRETLAEQVERLVWIGDDAAARGAEVMLCAGDVFERTSTPAERNAAIEVFGAWASRMPVVVVYGNHDRPGDLDYLAAIRTKEPIAVRSRPDTVMVGNLTVACLPWPRKAWLAGKVAGDKDLSTVATEAMRTVLHGLTAAVAVHSGCPSVLLAHVEIGSAKLDSGQPLTGHADIELTAEDLLNVGADYCALGHIHQQQVLTPGVCYAGSPRQTTFGQDPDKGYVLVDFETARHEIVRTPGRELVTIEAVWDDELHGLVTPVIREDSIGASVRLTYHVDAANREQAAAQADESRAALLEAGVHSVKLDPRVKSVHRVRSDAIRDARTNADRLRALWAARGDGPAREMNILAKLNELESEADER